MIECFDPNYKQKDEHIYTTYNLETWSRRYIKVFEIEFYQNSTCLKKNKNKYYTY